MDDSGESPNDSNQNNNKNSHNSKENSDLLNKNFFDLVEQKLEKNDKINKYKGNIESINEEMNESFEEQDEENKRNSLRSNKSKQIKIKKRINELEIKEITIYTKKLTHQQPGLPSLRMTSKHLK